MKKAIVTMLILAVSVFNTSPTVIEAQAPTEYRVGKSEPVYSDLVYHGDGETAVQLDDDTEITREESDVMDARNGSGRWEVTYETTPDHIEQEKIDDEISENFDTFCDVIYAESGNQGNYGMRLVADCIINRMRSGEAFDDTMHGVLYAKNQFSCISDGHAAKFRGHEKANVRKLAQEELMHVTDPDIYYFRTGHFFNFGTPKYRYKDVYFSGR